MGDIVAKEREVELASRLLNLSVSTGRLCDPPLIICCIADHLGKDILVNKLLYNPLSCLDHRLILIAATAILLLTVLANLLRVLARVSHDQALDEVD